MAEATGLQRAEMKVAHKVHNVDVVDLWYRFQRCIEEIQMSTSSGQNDMRDADLIRLREHLKALRDAANVSISAPELDQPVIHPREYDLGEWLDTGRLLENDSLDHICRLLVNGRDELVSSAQTVRQPNGIHKRDGQRMLALLDRVDMHVSKVVESNDPLDYPETQPSRDTSPLGRQGI